MTDIKPGMFVGSAGMMQPDGSQKAIEVHIFPEAMRGTGEGHYDWDLQPNSKMTNANVEQASTRRRTSAVGEIQGRREETAGDTANRRGDLRNRQKGRGSAGHQDLRGRGEEQPDGTLQAPRITYGRNGQAPAF